MIANEIDTIKTENNFHWSLIECSVMISNIIIIYLKKNLSIFCLLYMQKYDTILKYSKVMQ